MKCNTGLKLLGYDTIDFCVIVTHRFYDLMLKFYVFKMVSEGLGYVTNKL